MLDLLGSGYVIDYCVSALSINQQEKMYRIYITDCLKYLTENTTHLVGVNGVVDYGIKMTERWIDLREKKPQKVADNPNETKTTEEIVDGIWAKIMR